MTKKERISILQSLIVRIKQNKETGYSCVETMVEILIDMNTSEAKRFTPPTMADVSDYARKIEYQLDTDKFINSYEQKGWMVGKNKMKNWKAAVRNWKSNGWGKKEGALDYLVPLDTDPTEEEVDRLFPEWAVKEV